MLRKSLRSAPAPDPKANSGARRSSNDGMKPPKPVLQVGEKLVEEVSFGIVSPAGFDDPIWSLVLAFSNIRNVKSAPQYVSRSSDSTIMQRSNL